MPWVQKMTAMLGLDRSPRLRKLVIAVIGSTVVMGGVALIILPGPAFIIIPVGLVILASEFAWARWILRRGRVALGKARHGKWREAFCSNSHS